MGRPPDPNPRSHASAYCWHAGPDRTNHSCEAAPSGSWHLECQTHGAVDASPWVTALAHETCPVMPDIGTHCYGLDVNGISLCGPIVFADAATRTIATNQSAPEGRRPPMLGFANATAEWGGLQWSTFVWQFLAPLDERSRGILMMHELFHRVEPLPGIDDGRWPE